MKLKLLTAATIILATIPAIAELPDAPTPMAFTVSRPSPVKPIKYLSDRVNRELIAAEFTFRILDAVSTEQFMHDPCHCIHERVLPLALVQRPAAMYAYSLGAAVGVTVLSRELWQHGHHKLAKIALMGDIGDEALADAGNWKLINNGRK